MSRNATRQNIIRTLLFCSHNLVAHVMQFDFYEFFAGGGMVRAGLGTHKWRCVFANDFDHKKAATYRDNWGMDELRSADIRSLACSDLPGQSDLAWASFPCQDLSLAGGGAGLKGDRSGTFWPFWRLMEAMIEAGRGPRIVALENVYGTLTSHGGKDFEAICCALVGAGYRFGAVIIDAAKFVPHSRPRLFIVGVAEGVEIPDTIVSSSPSSLWHPTTLRASFERLDERTKSKWVWWRLANPATRSNKFEDLIELEPSDVNWHSQDETQRIIDMMSEVNLAKLEKAKSTKTLQVGAIYRRTRIDEHGVKVQRAEVRFDDLAGCLRTPAGGSSRQLVMIVKGNSVRSRLISGRETARLMGLPDSYRLPRNYNETYHLTGDGVVVPVVRFLSEQVLEPILASCSQPQVIAA
jgi:DNA (cytosine-5)-methyltransferase 1